MSTPSNIVPPTRIVQVKPKTARCFLIASELAAAAAILVPLAYFQAWPVALSVAAVLCVAIACAASLYGLRLRRIEVAREIRVPASEAVGPVLWGRFRGP
jgi:hypothetical protein